MRHCIVILILCTCTFGYAQRKLYGKVVDSLNRAVPDLLVVNANKSTFAVTDSKGIFSLEVAKKDTLTISSVFYEDVKVVVTRKNINGLLKITVKDKLNELAAVEVTDSMPVIELDAKEYTNLLQMQIANDRKKNYYYYMPKGGGGIGLQNLFPLVNRVFKNGNEVKKTISYKELDSLFNASEFFTKELLLNQLHIPEDRIFLFYNYCEVQNLNDTFLKPENEFLLLDKLVGFSVAFLEELEKEE